VRWLLVKPHVKSCRKASFCTVEPLYGVLRRDLHGVLRFGYGGVYGGFHGLFYISIPEVHDHEQ
jgi:hypothetical protein